MTKERNQLILEYLFENPIKFNTQNCYSAVCDEFNVNSDVIRGILRRNPTAKQKIEKLYDENSLISNTDISTQINSEYSENVSTGVKSITKKISKEIKSVEELIEEFQIDTSKYEVLKWKCSTWQANRKGGETAQLYAINCEIRPKSPLKYNNILQEIKNIITSEIKNPTGLGKVTDDLYFNPQGQSLFVYLSDSHVGAMTEKDSLYGNEYNSKIFADRMRAVLYKIYNLYTLHHRFDNIYIVNLGDCIDGFNNSTARGGHFLPQNISNKGQFEVYFQVMKSFFDELYAKSITKNLHFVSVGDSNHAGSLEYVLNRTIEIYLNTKYPSINTVVFEKFIEHIELGENTFIFLHGKDSEAMKHGLPLILNDKTEVFLNDYIYQRNIKSKNIYIVKGDLHQSAHQWGKRFKYVNVLSLFGSSKWIQTNFGSGRAGVEFQIVDYKGTYSVHEEIYF